MMNSLILGARPKVKSVCLRRPGAARGLRLIPTQALFDYLYSNIDTRGGDLGERQTRSEDEREA